MTNPSRWEEIRVRFIQKVLVRKSGKSCSLESVESWKIGKKWQIFKPVSLIFTRIFPTVHIINGCRDICKKKVASNCRKSGFSHLFWPKYRGQERKLVSVSLFFVHKINIFITYLWLAGLAATLFVQKNFGQRNWKFQVFRISKFWTIVQMSVVI